jgi:hypothetical protein
MTVLGLMLTMTGTEEERRETLRELAGRLDFDLGEAVGDYLPLTLEAPSPRSARETLRWLEDQAGIGLVQLVLAYWDVPGPARAEPPAVATRAESSAAPTRAESSAAPTRRTLETAP